MRLAIVVAMLFLTACSNSIGQAPSDEQKEEQEFNALINKVQTTTAESHKVQQSADQKTQKIIVKAATTIVTLKDENKQLKQDLNEATSKLDSIVDLSNSVNFRLRAISDSQENR